MDSISQQAAKLSEEWATDARWKDTSRTYSAEEVIRLRGSVQEEYTLARLGAERLRKLLAEEDAVTALGAITGNQAVQQVKAGLKAIYLSGWQVAADGNLAGQTYPDQSLYPVNSVPQVVRRINNALLRADQISWSESADGDVSDSPVLAGTDRGRRRSRIRRRAERVRADEVHDRRGRGRACTTRTSSRPRRSAATWAGRSSSRPASTSRR